MWAERRVRMDRCRKFAFISKFKRNDVWMENGTCCRLCWCCYSVACRRRLLLRIKSLLLARQENTHNLCVPNKSRNDREQACAIKNVAAIPRQHVSYHIDMYIGVGRNNLLRYLYIFYLLRARLFSSTSKILEICCSSWYTKFIFLSQI